MLVIELLFGKHPHFGLLNFFMESGESDPPQCEATLWMTGTEECVRNIWITSCRRLDSVQMCPMNLSYMSYFSKKKRKKGLSILEVEFTRIWQFCQHLSTKMECIEDDEVVETVFLETVGFVRTKSWTRWNWCLMRLGFSHGFQMFSGGSVQVSSDLEVVRFVRVVRVVRSWKRCRLQLIVGEQPCQSLELRKR